MECAVNWHPLSRGQMRAYRLWYFMVIPNGFRFFWLVIDTTRENFHSDVTYQWGTKYDFVQIA
jgi:hypothetical protein